MLVLEQILPVSRDLQMSNTLAKEVNRNTNALFEKWRLRFKAFIMICKLFPLTSQISHIIGLPKLKGSKLQPSCFV